MDRRKTAGELSLKAKSDTTRYDPLEIGVALTDDICEQLQICAKRHYHIFDEDEYCLVLVIASDPLIAGVRRHKYYAYPYLPSPRPEQSVFLYNKINGNCKRLWSLPNAKVMAIISEMPYVDKRWTLTKFWSDSFFNGTFWQEIRDQHKISMLSEIEYLNANRSELIKAGCNEVKGDLPDTPYFPEVSVKKVVDKYEPILD